jgi:hypothetical protein
VNLVAAGQRAAELLPYLLIQTQFQTLRSWRDDVIVKNVFMLAGL